MTIPSSTGNLPEIIIDKEDAVFRMDSQGRWHNEDGPITKKSIVRYLHSAIEKDQKGYYVTQVLGDKREKVYFRYEDTALQLVDISIKASELSGLLNTRRRLTIDPTKLYIKNDSLYLHQQGHTIKFSERALVKLSSLFEDSEATLSLRFSGQIYRIPNQSDAFDMDNSQ